MEKIKIVDRPLESFEGGESASFVKEITSEDIETFVILSGDHNPLHSDESYARTTRYKKRIAHGQLVAAPISALAGHLLPGKRCLLLEVRFRFIHPVFPGDRLTYKGTVIHISVATQAIKVQVEVTNQEGAVVLRGSYEGQVLSGPSEGDRT